MYIQPFWCGFICGCLVMIGAFVALLVHAAYKREEE